MNAPYKCPHCRTERDQAFILSNGKRYVKYKCGSYYNVTVNAAGEPSTECIRNMKKYIVQLENDIKEIKKSLENLSLSNDKIPETDILMMEPI